MGSSRACEGCGSLETRKRGQRAFNPDTPESKDEQARLPQERGLSSKRKPRSAQGRLAFSCAYARTSNYVAWTVEQSAKRRFAGHLQGQTDDEKGMLAQILQPLPPCGHSETRVAGADGQPKGEEEDKAGIFALR